MRKQILALLSALGLAGSTAPALTQKPKDGTSNTIKTESTLKHAKAARNDKASPTLQKDKCSKNRAESNALKTSSALKSAQASGKRIGKGQPANVIPPGPNVSKTRRVPPGPNTMNLNAGRADKLGNFQTGPTKTLTLNPQPLPPGAHTLNPQPLPAAVDTSNTQMTSSPNKTAIGSGTSGAGAGKDKFGNTSSAASRKASKSVPKPQ